MDKEYFRVAYFESMKVNETGELEIISTPTTYVTPKGIDFIRDLLVKKGYLPQTTVETVSSYPEAYGFTEIATMSS